MRKDHRAPRTRAETLRFRTALMQLRREQGWSQSDLGARLGVSKRTLSSWECGYWLPPEKLRPHVVLALRDAPVERLRAIAAGLALGDDPAIRPLLEPPEPATAASDPAPPPAPPPADPAAVRAAVDGVVRESADALDVRSSELRSFVARVVAACGALGATLDDVATAIAPAAQSPRARRHSSSK